MSLLRLWPTTCVFLLVTFAGTEAKGGTFSLSDHPMGTRVTRVVGGSGEALLADEALVLNSAAPRVASRAGRLPKLYASGQAHSTDMTGLVEKPVPTPVVLVGSPKIGDTAAVMFRLKPPTPPPKSLP